MSDYEPTEEDFIRVYGVDGIGVENQANINRARRGIAKLKADAWDEGYETGCSSPYGTATPSGKPYDPEPNPHRERGRAMSEIYDRSCTTCGHKINDHDANECWKTVDGKQCECGWIGVPNE